MPDVEVVAAVEALAAIAESHGDEPWAVEWLRAHAARLGAGDEQALLELRDHLRDLEHDLVVEHGDARAERVIGVLQSRLAATSRPGPAASPGPQLDGAPSYFPRPRDEPRLSLIAAALGAALVVLGLAAVLAGNVCGSARRDAGIVLAVLGGAVGCITISLRALELRRRRGAGEDMVADPVLLTGLAQLASLVVTWLVVHQLGCTILGR